MQGRDGNLMFSRKSLVHLIAPLIVEQIFLGTIGITDMLMVAPVGETAISGISLVNSINMLFHSIFSALAAGGGILCTQYLGKGEEKSANLAARQLLVTACSLAVLVMAVCCVGNRMLLHGLFGTAEADVLSEAVTYFYLAAFAYPCIMVFDACGALFRGMGESRIPLFGSTVMCIVNVILNAVFIYGLRWGVFGAGLASLLAKAGGSALLLLFLADGQRQISLRKVRMRLMDGQNALQRQQMQKNILRLAIPMAMEDGVFHIGKLLVQGVVTSYGTTAIAANAVALTIADVTQMPVYAMGLGLTTVIGQCIGAGEKEQARMYAKKILTVSFAVAALMSASTFIGADVLTRMYRLTDETAAVTRQLIQFHAIICGISWVFAFNIPCVLRAASDVNFILIVSVFSMWTFRVGCSYLFRELLEVGVLSVWMAMGLDWIFRAAVYLWRLHGRTWTEKKFI